MSDAARGPIERATLAAITDLRLRTGGLDLALVPLAELALELSRQLDAGALGMAVAAVSKELRATLAELAEKGSARDDEDPFEAAVRDLASP